MSSAATPFESTVEPGPLCRACLDAGRRTYTEVTITGGVVCPVCDNAPHEETPDV